MARDEEMAMNFYRTGSAQDLADRLVEVLESDELQRRMAAQNFAAAVRMTMPSVVRHYLRWFALAERKRALGAIAELQSFRSWSRTNWRYVKRDTSPDLSAAWNGEEVSNLETAEVRRRA